MYKSHSVIHVYSWVNIHICIPGNALVSPKTYFFLRQMLKIPLGFCIFEPLNSTVGARPVNDDGLWIPGVLRYANMVIIMDKNQPKTSTPRHWCFFGRKDWQIMWHAGKVVKACLGEYTKTRVEWMKRRCFQKVPKGEGMRASQKWNEVWKSVVNG